MVTMHFAKVDAAIATSRSILMPNSVIITVLMVAMVAIHSGNMKTRHATWKLKPIVASCLNNRVSHSPTEFHAQDNMDRGHSSVGLNRGGVSKRGQGLEKGGALKTPEETARTCRAREHERESQNM